MYLNYSGTTLLWTPLEQIKLSWLKRCPHFRGSLYTKANFRTPESVLIIEVSLFQSVLIREIPLYLRYGSSQYCSTQLLLIYDATCIILLLSFFSRYRMSLIILLASLWVLVLVWHHLHLYSNPFTIVWVKRVKGYI